MVIYEAFPEAHLLEHAEYAIHDLLLFLALRAVVGQRMAIIEAILQPDEKERQKALERVGQHSGRLRVWTGAPDEKPQLVLWYEHGQPVQ